MWTPPSAHRLATASPEQGALTTWAPYRSAGEAREETAWNKPPPRPPARGSLATILRPPTSVRGKKDTRRGHTCSPLIRRCREQSRALSAVLASGGGGGRGRLRLRSVCATLSAVQGRRKGSFRCGLAKARGAGADARKHRKAYVSRRRDCAVLEGKHSARAKRMRGGPPRACLCTGVHVCVRTCVPRAPPTGARLLGLVRKTHAKRHEKPTRKYDGGQSEALARKRRAKGRTPSLSP